VVVAVVLGISLLVSTGVRAYAAQTFYVPSGSMLPTLQIGDHLVVDKLSSTIYRGDIVVFRRAPGDTDPQYADLVKRVIGLPGETIATIGNTVLIDGRPIAQPWLPPLTDSCSLYVANLPTTRIPSGHYFVMGDCRGNSSDSRYWGTVPSSNIVGKVTVVVWRHNHPWLHWF
jgi:signal peptidase I